jgi:hypothetical protein
MGCVPLGPEIRDPSPPAAAAAIPLGHRPAGRIRRPLAVGRLGRRHPPLSTAQFPPGPPGAGSGYSRRGVRAAGTPLAARRRATGTKAPHVHAAEASGAVAVGRSFSGGGFWRRSDLPRGDVHPAVATAGRATAGCDHRLSRLRLLSHPAGMEECRDHRNRGAGDARTGDLVGVALHRHGGACDLRPRGRIYLWETRGTVRIPAGGIEVPAPGVPSPAQ